MKYLDEYRDPDLAKKLLRAIDSLALEIGERVTIMEVCGSHTYAIGRFGIRKLLPENVRLISGPGCPVCVTSINDVDRAIYLAGMKNIIFATFGDMLRVPGTNGASLQKARAAGADIRVISSAMDCISLAGKNDEKTILMMGIGFETTAPTVASMIKVAEEKAIRNLAVFSVHKLVPPALLALISDPAINIDGFLCPGHVSTIIGADAYMPVINAGKAAAITGFEPVDILEGIFAILKQIAGGTREVAIPYARAVSRTGNTRAREIMDEVFYREASVWRGLGEIPASGLRFRQRYNAFDATERFVVPPLKSIEARGCACGHILRGALSPHECPLFSCVCTPLNPVGPCMVSSEGTCAAHYKYH